MPNNLRKYKEHTPSLAEGAYVDGHAAVIGRVSLGPDSSVWPMTVIRGDVNRIEIGSRTNIQDCSMLHVSRPKPTNPDGFPTIIGDDVTVGHKVMLHGCRVGSRVLIGMNAVVLDGAVIEDEVILAAGSLVPPGKVLSSGYLYLGSPAKQIRPLSREEMDSFKKTAEVYMALKADYDSH